MEQTLKGLVSIGMKGSFVGIVISMLYMLASYGTKFNLTIFLFFLVFGVTAGFLIAFLTALADMLFKNAYARFGKYIIIPQLITTFVVSASVLFCESFVLNKLLIGYYPSVDQALNASFWTAGTASVTGSLIFNIIVEKEEKLRLEKENRELAVIEERSRIARELHDSVSQNLFGISLNLKTLEFIMNTDTLKAKAIIAQLDSMVQEVQTEMRLMIYELRPISLENKGFFEALENLASLFRIRYNLDLICYLNGDEDSIDINMKAALYRIVQEALNNVAKHANAVKVVVNAEITGGKGSLQIKDNGKGFDTAVPGKEGCFGLQGMKDRAKKMGASLDIESTGGKGTSIKVRF